MDGDGDSGAERVVKHKRFSLPVGLKVTRRNRAPTASSSRAIGPTYHSFAFAPESFRKAWFVAPSAESRKSTTSVVPSPPTVWEGIQGLAARSRPPRTRIHGTPAP